ncbi:MAG: hypothetical protein GX225_05375 [Clostridiales bacterium]|nr:hypothetical protein [Clostridiales bacterium]
MKSKDLMHNKLPLDPVADDDKDYFLNQRGAKVYKDVEKQPMLPLADGQNKYYVSCGSNIFIDRRKILC